LGRAPVRIRKIASELGVIDLVSEVLQSVICSTGRIGHHVTLSAKLLPGIVFAGHRKRFKSGLLRAPGSACIKL